MATPSNLYGLLGAVNTKDKWGHADKAHGVIGPSGPKQQSRIVSNLCFRTSNNALFDLGYH